MSHLTFKNYLINEGFYFNTELLENYLLSLKIKPFVIFTGKSGTGKTKLPQLYAKYLKTDNLDYYMIKVSTLKRSHSGGKDKKVGWGIYSKYLKDVLPIDVINGEYDIEIGGFESKAKFSLVVQLYYDNNNEKFKEHFKELHKIEMRLENEDKKANRKHIKQMVDLGVSYYSLRNIITEDFRLNDEITLKSTLTDDVTKGKPKFISEEIFDYLPLNKKMHCKITINGLFANAHFELKLRMRGYATNEIKSYLKNLKMKNESHFEFKVKGFKSKFEKFEFYNDNLLNNKKNYELMPVGADWSDGSHILGYYNAIVNKFQYTPVYFLIETSNEYPNPNFLILDEMNSAPMDNYLVDLISAMESNEEIPLYGNEDTLKLPKNFFILGNANANIDGCSFSPKILDRANVIELPGISMDEYGSLEDDNVDFEKDVEFLQSPFIGREISEYNIHKLKEILSGISYKNENLYNVLMEEISKFQESFGNSEMMFNFRVVNEILKFMVVAWKYENSLGNWDNWERYFDAQIKQRILPKIYGSQKMIINILIKLFNLCLYESNYIDDIGKVDLNKTKCKYYSSALKIQNMFLELNKNGQVSFMD